MLLLLLLFTSILAQTPQQKAKAKLQQMNLDQKISMVHGWGGPYVGNVPPISSLGIPALTLEDGPQGVADGVVDTTCWPSALTVVSTWDTKLMYTWARAMALEQKMKGTNIMLGPMINIARVPVGGRNFESYGEDPHLSSRMVVESIKGIQSHPGMMACAKHWVDNNQELNRTTTNANIDERTQHEIYFPAFKAAVDAGTASVMCSYNKINGFWACENEYVLTTVLKHMWGYQGFVMSDWGATHSTVLAAKSGLDQEMPDDRYFGNALKQAVLSGAVPAATLDDKVYRILVSMYATQIFENPPQGNLKVDTTSKEHNELARNLSAHSTVLLKNDNNFLPFKTNQWKKIAIIGDDGHALPIVAGGGSGHVIPPYVITPLEGIRTKVGSGVTVTYTPSTPLSAALKAAAEADVAIVFVAQDSGEGHDRENLQLGGNQDALVSGVAGVQANTLVVLHICGAVTMPWIGNVKAVLNAWMPGQEDGNAIADVIFGTVNPSARLPITFPMSDSQTPVSTVAQYPGIDNEAQYSEKLEVGYRWYDAKQQKPLFPFGFGLSYTTFSYSNLKVFNSGSVVAVTFTVTNVGKLDGAEVAQMYLSYPASAGEPPNQLRGFDKKFIKAGEQRHFAFQIDLTGPAVSIWDVSTHNWAIVKGQFGVHVGPSSRSFPLNSVFQVK